MKSDSSEAGIIVVGGGYKYFTNSWVNLNLIRETFCKLPIEVWIWEHEYDSRMDDWVKLFNAEVKKVATQITR